MNAHDLVDLLLEINVINVQDIDTELNKLAARIVDPRVAKWFKRVPRYFIINIDRLIKEPYTAKAEPRDSLRGSKYYADPQGGWRAGHKPEEPETSPLPVREQYDPKNKTYTTTQFPPLNVGGTMNQSQHDLEQSFTPFKPVKAKAKRLHGGAPTKSEIQPWMTAPGSEEKEFYHFDPIQVRRRELFGRLSNLINYLNYQSQLATKVTSENPEEVERAHEAVALMRRLADMKTDDIESFRYVMKAAANFTSDVKERPWQFTKDGQTVAAYNDLVMRKALFPETVVAFSRRSITGGNEEDFPTWCTKTPGHAETYAGEGPLYFIDKDERPYVLAHFPRGEVRGVNNLTISQGVAHEIAPLFADRARFPEDDILKIPVLAREVNIPDRSEPVADLDDGYRLVRFTQRLDLAREGALMQHCCGNTTYQDRLAGGNYAYYSLRDPENHSIVTIELERPGRVLQMKGVQNTTNFPANIKALLRQVIAQQRWQVGADHAALR